MSETGESFPFFAKLPPEVRRMIWYRALPRRVIDVDTPYQLTRLNPDPEAGHEIQRCDPEGMSMKSSEPPIIRSVCREAQQVARQWGGRIEYKDPTAIQGLWVQRKLDVLHLNWTRSRYIFHNMGGPLHNPLPSFLELAVNQRMIPSVLAEIVEDFPAKSETDEEGNRTAMFSPIFNPEAYARLESRPDRLSIVRQAPKKTYAVLLSISLHLDGPPEDYKLFGNGEEVIQLVDADDTERILAFQELWLSSCPYENSVDKLFHSLFAPDYQFRLKQWRTTSQWVMFSALWVEEKLTDFPGIKDPENIFKPPLKGEILMMENLPNMEHPWARRTWDELPELIPKILFRYCDDDCYDREEILPWELDVDGSLGESP